MTRREDTTVSSQQPTDDGPLVTSPEHAAARLTMNKRIDLIGSLLIAALGVFVLVVAYSYPPPRVVFDAVGPMGFPNVIGAFLLVGGLVQSLRTVLYIRKFGTWAPEEGVEDEPEHPSSKWRAPLFIAGCFGFLACLQPLGFLIAMPLAVVAALWAMQYGTWPRRIAVAVGFTIVAFVLFDGVLGVPLPPGPIGNLLIDLGVVSL
jgi:putative tricarboxylic transport membrane protein